MSIVIETFLICDGGCGRNFGIDNRNSTGTQQRYDAKINGWKTILGFDFCPECLKKQKPLTAQISNT